MADAVLATVERDAILSQRPALSAEQKRGILAAVAALIRAAVIGQAPLLADATLAGAAGHRVAGAFVSLKRRGHLRSCCGGIHDRLISLEKAIQDAAERTALDDVRFPPVSPSELEHLEMEVWVLYNPTVVRGLGEERVKEVEVGGRHGLIVSRGQARGLLLPGVAVEHNWDSRQFLEQVCIKAGLHPTLWKDDGTHLTTFEGMALRGRLIDDMPDLRSRSAGFWNATDLAAYVDFCRGSIASHLAGATPNYYLFGAPDGHLSGVVLMVGQKDPPALLTLSQLSLRPGVPLQSSLFALSQEAARRLAAQGLIAEQMDTVEVNVALLHDPAMHGTVTNPDLAGLNPKERALLVVERSQIGLVFDAEAAGAELVAKAARQARVRKPATAGVFSLDTQSTTSRILFATVPHSVPGPAVRPPAVAGRFYPRDVNELSQLVEQLLVGERSHESWSAALVPHAGLNYSGQVAAAVLKRLKVPGSVIVLGPKHTGQGVDWAVAPHQYWALPGTRVASDPHLARQLAEGIPGLELDALAHQNEHAIEVELPFLARLAPESRVVGLAIGQGDLEDCRRFARALAGVLQQREDHPLLLISSDMNHFATDRETRLLDEMALAALGRLDPVDVYETVTQNAISMCGVLPAVIVLETLRLLGRLRKAERVGYATSADVTGDPSRVVGYAGMLFGH
jgi:AmmeMemoRadiSam system protein B/AmmeMemoRadiSam system protein A